MVIWMARKNQLRKQKNFWLWDNYQAKYYPEKLVVRQELNTISNRSSSLIVVIDYWIVRSSNNNNNNNILFRQIKHIHIKHTYTITIYIKISYKYCKLDSLG